MFSPHAPHTYVLSESLSTCLVPHSEQSCVVYAGFTRTNALPALSALWDTHVRKEPHAASAMDLLKCGKEPRTTMFFMFRSSTLTNPYLSATRLASWWAKFLRLFTTRSCTLATTFLRLERCARASAFCSRLKKRGFCIVPPSENVANVVSPTSMPTSSSLNGSGEGSTSHEKLTNHFPVCVRETVQVFSTPSKGRWYLHLTSPTLESLTSPPSNILNAPLFCG